MWDTYVGLVDGFKLTTLIALLSADFVLGIIVSITKGEFQFSKLAQFLNTSVLTLIGGYYIMGLVVLTHTEWSPLLLVAWGLLDATFAGMIWKKLGDLGLPTPEVIKKIL